MKKFLGPLFIFFFSIQGLCQFQASIELSSGEILFAEVVHQYEARWFWETKTTTWMAVLPEGLGLESLRLISEKDIRWIEKLKGESTIFLDSINGEGMSLKRLPMNGPLFVSTGHSGHHLHENMYGDFAWDFEVRWQGERASGPENRNSNHYVWGKKVYSPVSGTVHNVFNASPDNSADPSLQGDLSGKGDGNFVLIHLKGSYFVSLLHFRKGSIPSHIKPGVKIKVGDYLGRVGNSGRSYLPHLHMTTYFWEPVLGRMVSVPNVFEKVSKIGKNSAKKMMGQYRPETGDSLINSNQKLRCF